MLYPIELLGHAGGSMLASLGAFVMHRPDASDNYMQHQTEAAHRSPCNLHDLDSSNLAKRIAHLRYSSVCI